MLNRKIIVLYKILRIVILFFGVPLHFSSDGEDYVLQKIFSKLNNYRLFALQDLDSWPGNDLALMEAIKNLKYLNKRPNYDEMNLIAMKWRPYRGAAALLLWHFHAKTKNK